MVVDSAGLGFSRQGKRILAHHPYKAPDGTVQYGSGLVIDYPFRFPDANAITRERVAIIEGLRSGGDAH